MVQSYFDTISQGYMQMDVSQFVFRSQTITLVTQPEIRVGMGITSTVRYPDYQTQATHKPLFVYIRLVGTFSLRLLYLSHRILD